MSGIDRIRRERQRQRSRSAWGEAYSVNHDDHHEDGELALAAAVYAMTPGYRQRNESVWLSLWPYNWRFKPSPEDRIRELEKAGALIAAEIDRLERRERAE